MDHVHLGIKLGLDATPIRPLTRTELSTRRDQGRSRQHPHIMAAARAKAANVGSAQWIQKERDQAGEFVEQELEEFGYSVRNEMEWLNEHMAEIFSTDAM